MQVPPINIINIINTINIPSNNKSLVISQHDKKHKKPAPITCTTHTFTYLCHPFASGVIVQNNYITQCPDTVPIAIGMVDAQKNAQMAELVDALVSNTSGKPCRFDPGSGYF